MPTPDALKVENLIAWLRSAPRFREDHLDHKLLDCAVLISNWIADGTAGRDITQARLNTTPNVQPLAVHPTLSSLDEGP
jgi:hypothetical protein